MRLLFNLPFNSMVNQLIDLWLIRRFQGKYGLINQERD